MGKIQNEHEKKMKIRWEHRIFKPAAQHAHAGALEEEGGGEGDEEEGEKEEEGGKNSAATRIPPRINLTFHVHTAEEEEKNENGGKVDVAAPEPPKVHTLLRPSVLNQRKKKSEGKQIMASLTTALRSKLRALYALKALSTDVTKKMKASLTTVPQ